MKIAVTGADGGLGSEICNLLLSVGLEPLRLSRSNADLERPDMTVASIKEASPEIIIHCAAMTNVDLCETEPEKAEKINVEGTSAVLKGAVLAGARTVFISTDFVFDGEKPEPYEEGDKTNPLNVYGKTKLKAEKLVSRADNSLIVRTSWLYGKTGNSFVKTMLRLGEEKRPLKVVDDQIGAPTYYPDLALAILDVVRSGADGIMHIANGGYCSRYEFAKTIFEIKGMDADISAVKSAEFPTPAQRPKNSRFNMSRFEKAAGREMRNWLDALEEHLNV